MSVIDELVGNSASYRDSFDSGDLPLRPQSASRSSPAWTRASTRTACSACVRAMRM
jgi:hypothetical protein